MAAGRFRVPLRAYEIMVVKPLDPGTPGPRLARYATPTGRFTIPRRSLKGLRQLPRKERESIRKARRKAAEA